MATFTYDLRDVRSFLYDASLIDFKNGNISLKLIDDFQSSVIHNINPTSFTGVGLDKISDGDPSTYYFDDSVGPQSQITWDLGSIVNISRIDFTLTQDPRLWDLLVVEATPDSDFTNPLNTVFMYASGDPTFLMAYPGSPVATDPHRAVTNIIKNLSTKVRAKTLRITIQASVSSPNQSRYLTNFNVYIAKYSMSNPKLISTKIIDTIDLTLLTETALTLPSGTAIGYTMMVNGQEWWFDGFGWSKSNGTFGESTSALNLIGKLSQLLPTRDRSRVQTVIYLHSSNSAETPTLTGLELQYDETSPAVNVPITRLTGVVRNAFGEPLENVKVTASFVPANASVRYTINNVRITTPTAQDVYTNENGVFVLYVVPTDNMIPSTIPTDLAKWRLTFNGTSYTEVLTDVVNSVEEIDIFGSGFGL